ncbi:glycosyltransferase [Qipengyuania qiaonensis]|uniref:Glycosyltransferase n=1 Tax=Qipengyuania qiaonensis TaxID=2867240 RepID=A0ABS7J9N5_9SPHN|nr:glycosyltransferase [Qipengyuania qiaonensis]MBX7483966.1 glycosyltransferase [Qipengyuania qiaonensis]
MILDAAANPDGTKSNDLFDWLRSHHDALSQHAAKVHALELDPLLWRGYGDRVLPRLQALLESGPAVEQAVAGWVLARWEASQQNYEDAYRAIQIFHAHPEGSHELNHPGPDLLAIELSLSQGDVRNARTLVEKGISRFGETPDFILAQFLLAQAEGRSEHGLSKVLGELHARSGLASMTLKKGDERLFDRLQSEAMPSTTFQARHQPLVSVIVPVFNSSAELPTALRGLLAQSWKSLEILLIDDGSSDDSVVIARSAAAQDPRVRVIEVGRNEGAYAARNLGLAEASGAFVTVHDADDWSHPQKIELQTRALMENPTLKASISHWVRMSSDMEVTRWRMEEGWIHRNVSSLMLRAELREELGYWDRVKVNADTEYYYRIMHAYGGGAIKEVCPGVPLAFGRTLRGSLTNQSATHLRSQYHGVRHDYMEAAHDWHRRSSEPSSLFLSRMPVRRPFRIPPAIAIGDTEAPASEFDLIVASDLMDEDWYLLNNPEAMQAKIGGTRHYLTSGAAGNRDPGPLFSTSGYRLAHNLGPTENPLLHFLRVGEKDGAQKLPALIGRRDRHFLDRKRVLVFAHTSGATLFGAERSFLDVVARLTKDGFAPVVVLPSLQNPAYLEQLMEMVVMVEVLPQLWRHGLHPPHPKTIDAIRSLIRKHNPCEIRVNTLTLEAPLIAARSESVPCTMYVRELPAEDAALCRALGMGSGALRRSLLEQVDRFIVPSQVVADWLECPDRCTVRPNAVDEELFDLPFTPGRILKVGLISSNVAKKGIGDFVATAEMIAALGPAIRFLLIGPQTPDLEHLGTLPPNVDIRDYADSPAEAIAQVDVVASLSHFAESFGRTVVEAMAAGRPVVCYNRGAPPSLIVSGKTGFVAPAGSISGVADAILALDVARIHLGKMSLAARQRAREIQIQALS